MSSSDEDNSDHEMTVDSDDEMEPEPEPELTPAEHKAKGNEFYKRVDYRSAIEAYTCAVESQKIVYTADPSDDNKSLLASFYSNRSAASMMILLHKESIEDCNNALELDSKLVKIHLRKAKQQITMGLIDEGIDSYNTALVLDPNNATGIKERDQAKMILKRFQLAKECLEKYKKNLQRIEGRQALAQVEVCLGVSPGWKDAKLVKCLALSAAGRADEAYGLTGSLMRSGMMGNSELIIVRAQCLYGMGDLDGCLKHYKQVLQGDPDNKDARESFKKVKSLVATKKEADDAYRAKNFDEAVEFYGDAIELGKDNPAFSAKLYNNRATAHANCRRHEECVKDCGSAIDLDPDYGKAYMRRATSLMMLGEKEHIEEAIRDYEKYASVMGEEVHREVQGKIRSAKVQLKRASRKDFYKILGVPKDANEAEIKKAYRKSALKHHPDRHATSTEEDKANSAKVFRDVNAAYEVLSDPKKKELYDSGVDEQDLDDPNARPGGHRHGGGFSTGGYKSFGGPERGRDT